MADVSGLEPIQRMTVFDEVIERLVAFILDGDLRPGDKLPPERELMSALSVGRSSLREGIKALRAIGAVEVVQGGGMFVGEGDLSMLAKPLSWGLLMRRRSTEEVIEARVVVERGLAGLAAQRATAEDKGDLTQLLERMREHVNDPGAYADADLAFHLAVAEAAHNRILSHVLETLQHVIRVWIKKVIEEVEHTPGSLDEHVPIYKAIMDGDSDRARRAMSEHLEAAGKRLLVVVPEDGGDGDTPSG